MAINYSGYSPNPRRYTPASEIFNQARGWAQEYFPQAMGSREQALKDVVSPAYYAGWQPTSLEQALGNQYFQNIMPDVERSIKQNLSLSGIESSPILAQLIAKQRGQTGFDVGQYLANQGQRRAEFGLNYRNIDPFGMINPYANIMQQQENNQTNARYEDQMRQFQAQQMQDLYDQQQKQSKISGMSSLAGGGIGALLAGALAIPTGGLSLAALPAILGAAGSGASLGSGIGGMASPLFGGGQAPIDIGTALSMSDFFKGTGMGQAQKVGSSNTQDLLERILSQRGYRDSFKLSGSNLGL